MLVGWSFDGLIVGGYLRRHIEKQIAGLNLVDAVVKSSPELLTPLAEEFAKTASSPNVAERTAATAEFLLACSTFPVYEGAREDDGRQWHDGAL